MNMAEHFGFVRYNLNKLDEIILLYSIFLKALQRKLLSKKTMLRKKLWNSLTKI